MLANAFGLPLDDLHVISTMVDGRDVFLELDQLPPEGTVRPGIPGSLPQGVAVGSILTPAFDQVHQRCKDLWLSPPVVRPGAIYGGGRSATVKAPDDTLIEVIEIV
ncbi:MAG: hypothetical protein AAF438_17610 [Pseudomonadota bacterium]